MSKQEKGVTKDTLIGMQVIDAEGHLVGTVKDVAFIVGKLVCHFTLKAKKAKAETYLGNKCKQ
ncbi:MAG: hypothetical protein ACPL0C_05790 [Candidatus Bathyarchaeales archaeon]